MSNRYYTDNSQLKITRGEGPVLNQAGTRASYSESTANWPGSPGSKGPKRNAVGFREIKNAAKRDMADDKLLTTRKAKQMLRDNSANGQPLTDKQKGLFGLIAGGGTPSKAKGYKG